MTNEDIAIKAQATVKRGGKATGEPVFVSALNEYTAPALTPELAYRYLTQNIHLGNNLVNMRAQIFPEEPVVDVVDLNENVDEAATVFIRAQWYAVQGYASMQRSWRECMGFGCSVKSPGYGVKGGRFVLIEIRDLPAITFRNPPLTAATLNGVANGLMPGISYDSATGEIEVWQTLSDGLKKERIKNFVIIRDPATPAPAGLAYCLPCYPVISAIDNANKAADQQVMRTGAPLIFPQLTTMSGDMKTWGEQFIKRWGKNVGFVLPPGVTFANPMIHESDSANVRLDKLIKWIDGYFNPTTVLRKEGSSIGGTDMAMMAVWNNFIAGTQAWLEYAYEEMLNPVLKANGYNERYVRIRLKRPQLDRATERREQVKIGILGKALLPEEIRKNLTELDLPDLDDELRSRLDAAYANAQPTNPFGFPTNLTDQPFGNVAPAKPENTEAYLDTEDKLVAAVRKCRRDVARIVGEMPVER